MWAVVAFAAGFGSIVGSFLNVVIHRLPRREPLGLFRKSRSGCPSCEAQIAWYDNIPLASWLALRGRCRACGWAIPFRYPLVEALTAALVATMAWRVLGLGWTPQLWVVVAGVAYTAVLIAGAAISIGHGAVPRSLALTAGLLALPALALPAFPVSEWTHGLAVKPGLSKLISAGAGCALAAAVLAAIRALYRVVLGSPALEPGAIPLGAAAGMWLGPQLALAGLVLGFLVAAPTGLLLRAARGKRAPALTPFLSAGFWVSAWWGDALWQWFLAGSP